MLNAKPLAAILSLGVLSGALVAQERAPEQPNVQKQNPAVQAPAANDQNRAIDQNRTTIENRTAVTNQNAATQKVMVHRGSKVIGMEVRNTKNEDIGDINDLMLDLTHGHVRYAAVSVGGFLGIGDKLFAVPWESLKLSHDDDEWFFVLDVDREKLRNAPGFDQNNWPDLGNPTFGEDVDRYYGVDRAARRTTDSVR